MVNVKKIIILIGLTSMLSVAYGNAFAQETQWQKKHPRREEVNQRLDKQDKRIKTEAKDGQISHSQAKQLHQQDHQLRTEERTDAKYDGGHITKPEQKTLNQQENTVSGEIGK